MSTPDQCDYPFDWHPRDLKLCPSKSLSCGNVIGVKRVIAPALLDAGIGFAASERVPAGVSYRGRFSDNLTDNAVKGRFTWLFLTITVTSPDPWGRPTKIITPARVSHGAMV